MAAPKGNSNAVGNAGGKSLQERALAARVRSLALKEIETVLKGEFPGDEDQEFYKAVLLKLAGTVLPRLNEVTGEGGEPIQLTWKSSSNTNRGSGHKPSTPA
jgi:hypothetical protein